MDHPNIARILDGGISESGSPYFLMELVKGVPITEFCDARKLTPKQRLELFIPAPSQRVNYEYAMKYRGLWVGCP